jgi:hypothetical protein
MKTVQAYLNHGRWLAHCPIHPQGGVLEVRPPEETFICPVCYPGSIASFPAVKNGVIRTIPDRSARATAQLTARERDDVYAVEYPPEREEILTLVSHRTIDHMNWQPGEPLDLLRAENDLHGVI